METQVKNLQPWQKEIIKSGLNWQVDKRPLFDEKKNKLPILGTFRSDNNQFLGTVSENYRIIQNSDVFNFSNDIKKEGLNLKYHSAGEYKSGLGMWVKYKLPFKVDVGGVGDILESFLMMHTLHNGSGSLLFRLIMLRLVCENGMTAFREHALSFIRHTNSAFDKMKQSQVVLANAGNDVKDFQLTMDTLAKVKLNVPMVGQIIENVFNEENSTIQSSAVKQNKARNILNLFELNDNDTFKKQRGSAYNLLNAFSRFTDHNQIYHHAKNETPEQAKIRGVLFGVGESLKMKALSEIVKLVNKQTTYIFPERIINATS